ncbi:MAG: hypothetical protein AB7S26_24510 [Sandaracinaceae bacterium]
MQNTARLTLALAGFALAAGCATPSIAPIPASDAGAPLDAPTDAGTLADAATGCAADLAPDGDACIGWRSAASPQRCLRAASSLARSDVTPPWTASALLAIACEGEATQLYFPDDDRWERAEGVTTAPLPTPPALDAPPDSQTPEALLAAARLADGTWVGIAGSLHAHPPFETWIADPGSSAWRRSIDAPWANPNGAGAIDDDVAAFVGDAAWRFVREPRAISRR